VEYQRISAEKNLKLFFGQSPKIMLTTNGDSMRPKRRRVQKLFRFCDFFSFKYLIALTFSALFAAPSVAEELVKFDALGQSFPIRGYLAKPKGAGPFPAVVLLHSCLGLPGDRQAVAESVASWGYLALFVDDFGTRGLRETCTVDFTPALSDAFGALTYLSTRRDVDPTRIAAVGFSQGADTALAIAVSGGISTFAMPEGLRFKAVAALYPPCANQNGARLKVPTLILVGEKDSVTPAADCQALIRHQSGGEAKLIVYPGADHLFDDPSVKDGVRVDGMWLKYDPEAAKRSKTDLRDFLATTLRR
jgi:dienelactone hydrolase